ncbi:MAG: DUF2961 domain-containing protein [Limisphaerales bacterium]
MPDIGLDRPALLVAIICILVFFSPLGRAEESRAPAGLLCDLLAHPEETVITTPAPEFGWIYNPSFQNDAQSGYRIIVASSEASASEGIGDLWDSGIVKSSNSINVPYRGGRLLPNCNYFWRVETDNSRRHISPFSSIQHFRTDVKLEAPSRSPWNAAAGTPFIGLYYHASPNIWANRYPLRFIAARPVLVTNTAPGRWFIDFGQDAFGYVALRARGERGSGKVTARFGEMARGLAVNTSPPPQSMVRYTNVTFALPGGDTVCSIRPPVYPEYDARRTINPPENFGVVMPFRYFELLNFPGTLTAADVTQERLLGEFDTNGASFNSSSPALNHVWNLCRNSMEMLTFDGIYVDGDRERRPYEADAYIHQLSAYAVDNEFIMPRYTFEYLLEHPTWPTEWKFHMIFIAWADYLQTGNADLLYRYYDALKPDLLTWAATGNGLIRGFPDFPFKTNSDVVDWPPNDRDGFVMKKGRYLNWTNSVNNAFYYRSLRLMANIATAIGRPTDADAYTAMAARLYRNYNATFWDSNSDCYVDGVGTTHASAHANFFPLAFGLAPPERKAAVILYLHSRIAANDGMPASVYGAQYLLQALFQSGDADTAINLMTTNGPRGWLNMIRMGSTLTTEAWSFADKKNLDWNHAWGAAPANLIARFVLGVRPISPGYGQILIQPELGSVLSYVDGTVPTIRGPVSVRATNEPGAFQLVVNIPGNVTATVRMPVSGESSAIAVVDGKTVSGAVSNGCLTVKNIGSGQHKIRIKTGGDEAVPVLPGLPAMENPQLLPLFPQDGVETRQFSSYDPSGANNDGNFKTAYTKYIDTNGEYVIFDASGPGCLYRQQINVWSRGRKKAAGFAHIRYYFDNESKPGVDMTIDDLFGGKKAPFTQPFAFLDSRPRFGILYYPFPFKKHLKVTTTGDFGKLPDTNSCWYQYTYLTYPDTNEVVTWAGPGQDSALVRNQWTHLGLDPKPTDGNITVSNSVTIPNGKTAVLAELRGAGAIAALKLRLAPYGRKEFYHAILRVYWDGAKNPAVDMPIGLFFGGGGETYPNCRRVPDMSLHTLFYGFDGTNHDFYCYWPMPYWHSARVELVNETGVDLKSVSCVLQYKPSTVLSYPTGRAGYFCAKRTLARDPGRGLFNTVFEQSGRGRVVGISFYSTKYAMDGDEFTYIDGSRTPQIHGDGTEDDHNQGYGGDAYQKALWGGLVNGYQTAYRLYYNDSYIFNQHIRINYEFSHEGGHDYGGENDVVVYYYESPGGGNLLLTDQLDVGDPASEAAHHYSISGQTWAGTRRSGYDGYERNYEYDTCEDDGRAFHGYSEFTVNISPANDGVELRRRLYRSGNGRQRATVYVNGVRVTERPWDVCTLSSAPWYQGWYDADFEIPAAYTHGKRQLRIRIEDAGGGKSDINEFYYWVYCFQEHPATKAPRRVRRLRATPSGAFCVNLQWSPARLAEQVIYYEVHRSEHPDFSHYILAGRCNPGHFSDSCVKPDTTYFYRVAAVDLSGVAGPFSEWVGATTGPDTQTAAARCVGTDETTRGNWATHYGSDGFLMPRYFYGRDCQALPDYVSAVDYGNFTSRQFASWNKSTPSSLLTSPISYCARYLGALETRGSDSLALYVNDSKRHQLALYLCDFNKAGRKESIEVLDLEGRVLVPAQSIGNFQLGKWLRFEFSGSIRLRITNQNSKSTAVLSALMFDPPGEAAEMLRSPHRQIE